MIKQEIDGCMPKNTKYSQAELIEIRDKLADLLSTFIAKTSNSNTSFRNVVHSYTDSTTRFTKTKVKVASDVASFRIIMKIWLIGYEEIWTVYIYTNRYTSGKLAELCNQIKKVSSSVCEEEDKKYLPPEDEKEVSDPSPSSVLEDLGAKGNDTGAVSQLKGRRKKRISTSSIVTDQMILEILKSWEKKYASVRKIDQIDFWKITSLLGIESNRLGVLAFLKKRGIIDVSVPIRRKPVVEITQLGIDKLNEYKHQLEVERLEVEKKEHLQTALTFPEKSLPSLRKLNSLQLLYLQLNEKELAEKEVQQEIAELQVAIGKAEKRLTEIQASQKKDIKEIKRLISLINSNNLAELIEIATKSAGQKDVKK